MANLAAHKVLLQQAAKRWSHFFQQKLWEEHPAMTIADMARRREILIDGNGKSYQGKNTLRNWLKVVAPPSVRSRKGRPKGSKTPREKA